MRKKVAAKAEQWMVEVDDFVQICKKKSQGRHVLFTHVFVIVRALKRVALNPFARGQVDQTCVGLAPATEGTWTNIYDLGRAITTFCSVPAS